MFATKGIRILQLLLIAAWAGIEARGATVRFEGEAISPFDQGDAVGYDNTVTGPLKTTDATSSNGIILEGTGSVNNKFKIGFVGTGINLITRQDTDGATFNWILDEGAQTGSGTTNAGSRADQASIPIIAGLANTLHTLELRPTGGTGTLRVDAVDILDAGTQTRFEQNDPAVMRAGVWGDTGGGSAEASGASIGFTTCGPGLGGGCGTTPPTMTLNFNGTAVSFVTQLRANSENWTYSIDNGAPVTLNLQGLVPNGIWQRWPILLANNLAPGGHTLVLSSQVRPGLPGIAVHIDAIDVFGVPEPTSLVLFGFAGGFAVLAGRRRS
jgi:hypothetical protein